MENLVEELLKEVKIKEKWKNKFQSWLEEFKTVLCNLPESETYKIDDLSWLPKKIKIPICLEPPAKKGQFKFLPPTNVVEVGSYAVEVSCSKNLVADVALEVPQECWVKTDFLNHMYHRKCAMYLAYIVKFLRKCPLVEDMKYSLQHGDHLKPVLLITPKDVCGKFFSVCLLPHCPKRKFKLNRFIPGRNNVRPSWFFAETTSNSEVPTPVYNSTILADILMPEHCCFLQDQISSANLKDGVILLKVWCKQRGLDKGYQGFNGFVMSMLVAYLLSCKKIIPLMSSYQVFRNTLFFIARHKWFETGSITLHKEEKDNLPSVEDFQELFDVVFIDPSGFLNIFSHLSKEKFSRICHEAEIALKILDSGLYESFSNLFINQVPFSRKFDSLLHIVDCAVPEDGHSLIYERNDALNHGNNFMAALTIKVCKILKQGLGKRIVVLDVQEKDDTTWPVSSVPPDPTEIPQVTFGLLLDPEFVFNVLEKGPVGTDPEAKNFREFWGPKSELRRFRDGNIQEAVLFPAETVEDQRSVVGQIAKYILQRHCEIDPANVHYVANNVDRVLCLPKELFPVNSSSPGTGEEFFLKFSQSFTALSKELRKLQGVPLMISSIQGVSAAFRFSEVIPPFSTSHVMDKRICFSRKGSMIPKENARSAPLWVPTFKVIIHLEGSGKWPDDKDALKLMKAAFHIDLAERITSNLSLPTVPFHSHIDVLKDGYVFRLEVACHKEITVNKRVKTEMGMVKIQHTQEALDLEVETEILPKLNSILHGLHQQHNSYGTTCRLAKRWIAAQLLSDYIDDVTVELIVAYLYISPAPFTVPRCPQTAFHRFLALLGNHDWKNSALIVNLNGQFTVEDISEIEANFRKDRSSLPPMFISTPLNKIEGLWTREKPTNIVLHRLVTISQASIKVLEKQIYTPHSSDFKLIFRPPLDFYDVIIHLDPLQTPKRFCAIDLLEDCEMPQLTEHKPKASELFPVVEFDPVEMYLTHLRANFDEFAYFFYDTYGGTYIAVLWKPDAFKPQPFKVLKANCCKPTTKNADGSLNIVPNVEYIMEYFASVDQDLVCSVEKRTEKWTIS